MGEHCENAEELIKMNVFIVKLSSHNAREMWIDTALFLQFNLQTTLIRHENEVFKPEQFETAGISTVFVSTENILKTELFQNDGFTIIM